MEDLGYLTLAEASKRYGVPRNTLKTAAVQGRLPTRKVGRLFLAAVPDLERYVKALRPRPTRRKPAH